MERETRHINRNRFALMAIIGVAATLLLATGCKKELTTKDVIEAMVSQLGDGAPKMLDEETRLEKVEMRGEDELALHVTLTKTRPGDMLRGTVETHMENVLRESIQSDPDTRATVAEYGIKFTYVIYHYDGSEFTTVTLDPSAI